MLEDTEEDEEDAEDAAQAAAEAAGTAAAPQETCEDIDGNPLVDTDGKSKCGCGALKREPGSKRAGAQVDLTHTDGDNEDRAAAALVELDGGTFTLGSDSGFFPEDGEGKLQPRQTLPHKEDTTKQTRKLKEEGRREAWGCC